MDKMKGAAEGRRRGGGGAQRHERHNMHLNLSTNIPLFSARSSQLQ